MERFEGRLIKLTGDGIMATFDGPGRAIHCAVDLRGALRGIGTTVRMGLHTEEIELRHDDIGGLTVHIAARVMGEAGPGEVLISLAVRDLLSSSARVNLSEATSLRNHCVVAGSSFGWLIHTAVGSAGGVGSLRTKRSGWAA